MKVSIQLTKTDLKTLIAKQLGLGDIDFTFTITEACSEGLDKIAEFINTKQKIAAIKTLRECVAAEKNYMGLADAKYAVEDFDAYRKACQDAGCFILTWKQSFQYQHP